MYQGRTAEAVERELEAMYTAARAAKIAVVAGSIIPYNTATADQNTRMHAVNDWIRDYVARHDAGMVFSTRGPRSRRRANPIAWCPLQTACIRLLRDTGDAGGARAGHRTALAKTRALR